jgi:hypothetical protein
VNSDHSLLPDIGAASAAASVVPDYQPWSHCDWRALNSRRYRLLGLADNIHMMGHAVR